MTNRDLKAIYKNGFDLIKHAQDSDCWIEVICLQESFLIARFSAWLGGGKALLKLSAGKLVRRVAERHPELVSSAFERQVLDWMAARAELVHRVFIADVLDADLIARRYERAVTTATSGEALIKCVRRIDNKRKRV